MMLLQPFNLLILDEPTNHLDMRSKDILKSALLDFDGTLIVVSHDREFLDGLVDKVYEFRDQGIREYLGGIFDFLEKRKLNDLKEIERKNGQTENRRTASAQQAGKELYEARKNLERRIRKAETVVEQLEKEITLTEKELADLDALLVSPEYASDHSRFIQYEKLQKDLEKKMEEWGKAVEEAEALRQQRN